jgi:prefoldin alpha subunit
MEKLTSEDRQKLQRILAELSDHQATADILRQQLRVLAASLSELSMTTETIKVIKGLKPDTEVLVPLGSDSYATAKIALTDKVITGLGADIAAERGVDEAVQVLEARMAEIGRVVERTRQELEKLGERIEALRPEAERILAKAKEER